jgi:wyosine [tRNA(Phe)-imidazoG37] synthetase (radical SAM superfamily)
MLFPIPDRKRELREKSELGEATSKEGQIVYGPVSSRRMGYSLGVNVTPSRGKPCSFDCVYCQYGRTLNLVSAPSELANSVDECAVLREVEIWLRRLRGQDQELNSITFSGYGEPTLFPWLKEVVLGVKRLRDQYYPGVRVDILTNSSTVTREGVFAALREFDSVVAKLDAGSQEMFEAINRPASEVSSLEDIVQSLAELQDATNRVTIQTLVFRSTDSHYRDNSSLDEMRFVAEKARLINPVEIQVYTVKRRPSESFVEPIDEHSMREAANLINNIVEKRCAKVYL